jgi:hypothetical protein
MLHVVCLSASKIILSSGVKVRHHVLARAQHFIIISEICDASRLLFLQPTIINKHQSIIFSVKNNEERMYCS